MLSLPKILLVLAVLAAVIIGTRLFRKLSAPADTDKVAEKQKKKPKDAADGTLDLVECKACGDFLDADAGRCDREDCPRT